MSHDGCPATRWDGGYGFRCGLGAADGVCPYHGRFASAFDADPIYVGLRSLPIYSLPTVEGGAPQVALAGGIPLSALLDRLDAGDSVEKVAQDFSCDPGSLELLVELRETLKPGLVGDAGLEGLRHPDCRACEERKRLSLGQLAEIKALKAKAEPLERRLREAESIIAECDSLIYLPLEIEELMEAYASEGEKT